MGDFIFIRHGLSQLRELWFINFIMWELVNVYCMCVFSLMEDPEQINLIRLNMLLLYRLNFLHSPPCLLKLIKE